MIKEFEFFHGVVLSRITNEAIGTYSIKRFQQSSNSSYIVNDNIGLYIKYSAKRLSPWRFTFMQEHQEEIDQMKKIIPNVFLILVCNDDGIVCLSYSELKSILDDQHNTIEWISAKRSKREMYTIKGSDGRLDFKVGANEFPGKIFSI